MNNLECLWRQSHLLLATKLRLYMTLIVPMLLIASETWISTKADLNYLQAFHTRYQRRFLGVRWFHKIKNADIVRRTGLPHIRDLIQKRRHALFGHVVLMDPQAPAHVSLKSTGIWQWPVEFHRAGRRLGVVRSLLGPAS